MIDLTMHPEQRAHAVQRAREQGVIIPTFEQMRNPKTIPEPIRERLRDVGLWDVNPLNLFRIHWHNSPTAYGGAFGKANFMVLPPALTGVKARIVVMLGKWFPTGAHKVGAAFGCLVPRLVTGQFDPTVQKAAWPSTGNYCRGGAYDSALLGCKSIAILPEGMSRERFDWLSRVAGQVIKTPGTESNVKEIFDKCWELRQSGDNVMVFNQFEEFGNYLWHYSVTGRAMQEAVLSLVEGPQATRHIKGMVLATGSGGTLAAGDYLKEQYPWMKIAAMEARQCPTLLANGFGDHRIEGIGDKHVPWIHNVRNTDMVIAIDDESCISGMRLFNEDVGREYLQGKGDAALNAVLDRLDLLGISGVGNVLAAIKFAHYYELESHDLVLTVATDSMEMYQSRLEELREARGAYAPVDAAVSHERHILGQGLDAMLELRHPDRKRIHNLKYYTWVEQQGRSYEEIQAQWYDPEYWTSIPRVLPELDAAINAFNADVGLMQNLL